MSMTDQDKLLVALETLIDIAEFGTRHDLTPTHIPGQFDYYGYMRSMDDHVRRHARRALEQIGSYK